MFGHLAAVVSLAVVALHMTGKLHLVGGWLDIGIEPRNWFFLFALPLAGVFGYLVLRDR